MKLTRYQCTFTLFFAVIVLTILSCDNSNVTNRSDTFNIGFVSHVVDGDTYDILIEGKELRIRMDGIDAPEKGQDFYKKSKEYLGQICKDRKIRVEISKKDRWGRYIAKSYNEENQELGHLLVQEGLAWHFKKYSDDSTLARLEMEAFQNKRGIWSLEAPTPPWEHRKNK